VFFFSEKLSSLCVAWLGDDISSIRQAAANNLKELTKLFGTDWAVEYLIPSVASIRNHPSYLRRVVALQACALMATEMEPETVRTDLLPMVLDMTTDTVPNIRFNVAKALQKIAPVAGPTVIETQIRPVINLLVDDLDTDVRFFAVKCQHYLDGEKINPS